METREVDDDGRQARQTLRGPRTTALGVLGGRPPGLQRTPRSDLYAYRSMMTGGGSPSDSLFLYLAPNGRNPALIITPRNEKSRRPISFWEMTSNKLTMDNSTCHSGFWVGSCASPLSHWLMIARGPPQGCPASTEKQKVPSANECAPAERSRSFAYLPPVSTAKNRLFFLGFQFSYSCRRRATAVSLLARQDDDVRPRIPRLSRRSLRSLATGKSGRALLPAQQDVMCASHWGAVCHSVVDELAHIALCRVWWVSSVFRPSHPRFEGDEGPDGTARGICGRGWTSDHDQVDSRARWCSFDARLTP